jgi:hypothetical protein
MASTTSCSGSRSRESRASVRASKPHRGALDAVAVELDAAIKALLFVAEGRCSPRFLRDSRPVAECQANAYTAV